MRRRIERRLFRLNDEIERLAQEEDLLVQELSFHRHIADDAQRDAIVGEADDRAFAREIEGDVPRFERAIEELRRRRTKLTAKRDGLLDRL